MKVRKGVKTIQLIDFNKAIDDVLDSLSFMEGFGEIEFIKNISVDQSFYSDKLLLVSIFENLVDNAIKYKRNIPDAFINISVARKNGGVKIMVADNGIGIPDNLQKDVYKMFFRATNQASGSGLGLYTLSHAIKKLGGRISLDSKENIGTTPPTGHEFRSVRGQTEEESS
jgi:signal transduction histidine kinase